MIDWNVVGQSLADGAAWGVGFAIPFFVGITWAILKILSHPTIRSIARAADKLSKGGDIWGTLAGKGMDWLTGGNK